MKFGFVECEEKRLNQTGVFRSIAKGFPGCMPEPRSEQNTPIEPHGYREQMFPFRLVITVSLGEVVGKGCTGLLAELRDFAIVDWRAIGAQFFVPVKFRAAAAMFRQGEIDDA